MKTHEHAHKNYTKIWLLKSSRHEKQIVLQELMVAVSECNRRKEVYFCFWTAPLSPFLCLPQHLDRNNTSHDRLLIINETRIIQKKHVKAFDEHVLTWKQAAGCSLMTSLSPLWSLMLCSLLRSLALSIVCLPLSTTLPHWFDSIHVTGAYRRHVFIKYTIKHKRTDDTLQRLNEKLN